MSGKFLYKKPTIITILILQFIPFVLFPPSSFVITSQEWWLPIVLALFALIAIFQLLARKSLAAWPWYLIGFAQGFNVISRLMMLMPHATMNVNGAQVFNAPYTILSLLSITLSWLMLFYIEKPEVKMTLAR
jgi:hypothetical protein